MVAQSCAGGKGLFAESVGISFINRYPSFYFSNLAPLSQSLKISCKAISPFLGK
jgi:hypothetical protein